MFTGSLPFSNCHSPYIALAPMEGLMDGHFRELLTAVGGIDHCVTEFVRITQQVYPERVFKRFSPELAYSGEHRGKTRAGTPVHVQLLGSDPQLMAENAAKVARMGAPAIDLNFGCPAKTVNKSQGGAVLLQWPELIHDITAAVRKAVPDHIPVSAKMRLGFKDKSLALENADALASAGIQWLTVHARTKTEGYKPPAYWEWISRIKGQLSIPVLANGEIWTPDNAQQCMQESGSDILMIGRGLVATPDLGLRIKAQHSGSDYQPQGWQQHLQLFRKLADDLQDLNDKQLTDRLKQWLHYFTMQSLEISAVFQQVKRERDKAVFFEKLDQAILEVEKNPPQREDFKQYQHSGF
ncbi:tRNA dihydrouridine synthase [Bacterioplanoides sp.]|uniref:tRNA dihydrouridine synthase n=1 Tax=Bacterioplanoides sp. TaxID=2066072 RepID=UPI003B5B81D7